MEWVSRSRQIQWNHLKPVHPDPNDHQVIVSQNSTHFDQYFIDQVICSFAINTHRLRSNNVLFVSVWNTLYVCASPVSNHSLKTHVIVRRVFNCFPRQSNCYRFGTYVFAWLVSFNTLSSLHGVCTVIRYNKFLVVRAKSSIDP
eukprot:456661_1